MDHRALRCCVCGSPLSAVDHEGVEIDACPQGCGVWLDRGELMSVTASEARPRPAHEELAELEAARRAPTAVMAQVGAEAARPCPVCARAMTKRDYPGSAIVMDACGEHGYWLDSGELERVEAYAEGMRAGVSEDSGGYPRSVRGIPIPPEVLGAALRGGP